MTGLRIAEGLTLPVDAVTETFGVLAKRGAGKSYTASVLAEEMLKAGFQTVIIDPLDVLWGLRSSADGKHEGLPIVVIGGEHGDLPLEATVGKLLADVVVEERLSCVLSLRHLSKSDQRRFVTDFCERLYHRKGEDRYRQPLHLIIDEADSFVPQRVYAGQERMVGAIDDLVRRGRSSGIGVTLITQRAAVINKDVLTQIETLIALRTISPQDRKALEAWIEAHDAHGQHGEFMASLASLPIGTAWVWSPGWLDLFERVPIRTRETFDSSATPKVGQPARTPTKLAEVDLDVLREKMAATIDRAKADDPKVLRRHLAELEKQLKARPTETRVETVTERIEVPVLSAEDLARFQEAIQSLADLGGQILGTAQQLGAAIARSTQTVPRPAVTPQPRTQAPPAASQARPGDGASDLRPRAGQRRILQVLAQRHPLHYTKAQLATLAKMRVTSGTFSAYMSELKRHGLIEVRDSDVSITREGLAEAGTVPTEAQSTEDVLNQWRGALRLGERRMLDYLVECYPESISRVELAEETGHTPTSGTFSAYLGGLRRNGLAEVNGDQIRASDTLFLVEERA